MIHKIRRPVKTAKERMVEMQSDQIDHRELEDMLTVELDSKSNPYSWAVTIYSSANLRAKPWSEREAVKRILRNYFGQKGMQYDGWEQDYEN